MSYPYGQAWLVEAEAHTYNGAGQEAPAGEEYYIIAEDQETAKHATRMVCSLIMGAVACGNVSQIEAVQMLASLSYDGKINADYRHTFEMVLANAAKNAIARFEVLAKRAIEGSLSSAELVEESSEVLSFGVNFQDESPKYLETLNRKGLFSNIDGEGLTILIDEGDVEKLFYDDSEEYRIAQQVGANAFAWQYEVNIPLHYNKASDIEIRSARVHNSLGKRDTKGEYMPIVTVISEDHPVRALPHDETLDS